jgi:hypothetical protein
MTRRVPGRRSRCALCIVLLLIVASSTWVHARTSGGSGSGIPIPSLTHGQMAVIADYEGAVLDLASRQIHTDDTFRRLLNYAAIQRSMCLWGLVPGSIRDEASPFNECSHAYLSALDALLLHMQNLPGDQSAVEGLVSRIDGDMVRHGAALFLCRYSSEAFDTADLIAPHWADIPSHWPSLATFLGVVVLLIGGSVAIWGAPGWPRQHSTGRSFERG